MDVVVCDGFVGNVILKSAEQLAKSMGKMIKQSLMSKLTLKLGALISKGAFKDFRKRTDYSEVGAPLLGVKGVVIIGHGISDGKAVMNGIRAVGEAVKLRVNKTIEEQVKEYETRHNGG